MKISELINSLTIQLQLHGDIDVVTIDSGWSSDINNVYYQNDEFEVGQYDYNNVIRNSIVLD